MKAIIICFISGKSSGKNFKHDVFCAMNVVFIHAMKMLLVSAEDSIRNKQRVIAGIHQTNQFWIIVDWIHFN